MGGWTARGFSLRMLLSVAGVGLWLVHGLPSRSAPIVLANTAALLPASCILLVVRRG